MLFKSIHTINMFTATSRTIVSGQVSNFFSFNWRQCPTSFKTVFNLPVAWTCCWQFRDSSLLVIIIIIIINHHLI